MEVAEPAENQERVVAGGEGGLAGVAGGVIFDCLSQLMRISSLGSCWFTLPNHCLGVYLLPGEFCEPVMLCYTTRQPQVGVLVKEGLLSRILDEFGDAEVEPSFAMGLGSGDISPEEVGGAEAISMIYLQKSYLSS